MLCFIDSLKLINSFECSLIVTFHQTTNLKLNLNLMLNLNLTLLATASKSPPVHGGWIPPPPGIPTYTHFLAKKIKYPKTYI